MSAINSKITQVRAQFGASTMRAGAPVTSGLGLGFPMRLVVVGALVLLNACGGGGDVTNPPPPPPVPIPDRLYQVDFKQSTNDCSASNLDAFKGLVYTRKGGSSLLGLDTVPIPATVAESRITFSDRIQLQGDTAVTFSGDWLFAEDSHTFDGTVSFAVSFGGPIICTFTLATAGAHAPDLNTPPAAPSGAPVSGSITRTEGPSFLTSPMALVSANPISNVWGLTASVLPYGGSCFVAIGQGQINASLSPPEPFVDARNTRAGQEEDVVAFRWTVYGFPDQDAATLSRLKNILDIETAGHLWESHWYWHYAFDPKPWVYAPPEWIDLRGANDPQFTTFSQSSERSVTLSGPGFYFVVLDVYWYDREGIGSGWYRSSGDICSVPAQ